MSVIKVTLPVGEIPVSGKQISFTAPCSCKDTEALEIDGARYTVVDALCKCVTGVGGRWDVGAIVSVILDTKKKYAFYQNSWTPTAADLGAASGEWTIYNKLSAIGGGLTTTNVTMDGLYAAMTNYSELNCATTTAWPSAVVPSKNGELRVVRQLAGKAYALFYDNTTGASYVGVFNADGVFMGWNKLATTATALMRDGSNAMTGNLMFKKTDSNPDGGVVRLSTDEGILFGAQADVAKNTSNRALIKLRHSRENVADALQLLNGKDGKTSTYDILHTGSVPSAGNFITGSYVGTGTYGPDHKNELIFPFEPKHVVVSGLPGELKVPQLTFHSPCTEYGYNQDVFALFISMCCGWDGNRLQWWLGDEHGDATHQANSTGVTYYYAAWG